MTPLESLYSRIPIFRCAEGCHDCCQRPMFAPEEWAAIEHKRVATGPDCPYLGAEGCAIYPRRPFVCRLFGAVEALPCPRDCGPARPLSVEETTELARAYVDLVGQRKVWVIGSEKVERAES